MERIYPPRDLPVKVLVSDHARERARERFPGYKTARIVDEVRLAIREGRLAATKPGDCKPDNPRSLYAWTPDQVRVFVLRPTVFGLVVTTVYRRGLAA